MEEFFINNYQWLVPLIVGGVLVPFAIHYLQKNRKAIINNFFKTEQKSNRGNTFYQAEKIIVKQTGLSVADVKDIVISTFRENFPKLQAVAKEEAKKNTQLFASELEKRIINKLNTEEISKFQDPDIQYVLYEAIKSSARRNSEELRKNLATLIVERVKNDDKDLKRIAYNEAIGTIGKLTPNQLKILTLCFLLKYTQYTGILNWTILNQYLNTRIKPFLDFKNTHAEFQHIEYAGCGSIGIGSWDFIRGFRENYSFLFLKPFEQNEINQLNIPDDLKQKIISHREGKYFIRFRNKKDLEDYLKEKSTDTNLNDRIINAYQNHIQNEQEIREKLRKETDIGKDLIKMWEDSDSYIQHLSLTSVGIVIGASYYEQIIGEKIDIDIWIN